MFAAPAFQRRSEFEAPPPFSTLPPWPSKTLWVGDVRRPSAGIVGDILTVAVDLLPGRHLTRIIPGLFQAHVVVRFFALWDPALSGFSSFMSRRYGGPTTTRSRVSSWMTAALTTTAQGFRTVRSTLYGWMPKNAVQPWCGSALSVAWSSYRLTPVRAPESPASPGAQTRSDQQRLARPILLGLLSRHPNEKIGPRQYECSPVVARPRLKA